jgi:hypothetical protein
VDHIRHTPLSLHEFTRYHPSHMTATFNSQTHIGMFFQECSVGQYLHLLKSIEHIKTFSPTYLTVPHCSESIASSHREGYQYTLLSLPITCFSQVLSHGISDQKGWVTTTVNSHGSHTHLLEAISITFRDSPFVKGSVRFLSICI